MDTFELLDYYKKNGFFDNNDKSGSTLQVLMVAEFIKILKNLFDVEITHIEQHNDDEIEQFLKDKNKEILTHYRTKERLESKLLFIVPKMLHNQLIANLNTLKMCKKVNIYFILPKPIIQKNTDDGPGGMSGTIKKDDLDMEM